MDQQRSVTCPTCGSPVPVNEGKTPAVSVRCPKCAEFIILPSAEGDDDGYQLADPTEPPKP
jgi:predicted RNA-binding Zn-ribbon protein involved in translation (DUF1610 family)